MDQNDHDYFERRYRESLQRADAALDPTLAELYYSFATHYFKALGSVGLRSVACSRGDAQRPTGFFVSPY